MSSHSGKRLSILKKNGQDIAESTPTPTNRRISFSGKKSVKEFMIDDDKMTIWGSSYEESASAENLQNSGHPNSISHITQSTISMDENQSRPCDENRLGMTLRNRKVVANQTVSKIWDMDLVDKELSQIGMPSTTIFNEKQQTIFFGEEMCDIEQNTFELLNLAAHIPKKMSVLKGTDRQTIYYNNDSNDIETFEDLKECTATNIATSSRSRSPNFSETDFSISIDATAFDKTLTDQQPVVDRTVQDDLPDSVIVIDENIVTVSPTQQTVRKSIHFTEKNNSICLETPDHVWVAEGETDLKLPRKTIYFDSIDISSQSEEVPTFVASFEEVIRRSSTSSNIDLETPVEVLPPDVAALSSVSDTRKTILFADQNVSVDSNVVAQMQPEPINVGAISRKTMCFQNVSIAVESDKKEVADDSLSRKRAIPLTSKLFNSPLELLQKKSRRTIHYASDEDALDETKACYQDTEDNQTLMTDRYISPLEMSIINRTGTSEEYLRKTKINHEVIGERTMSCHEEKQAPLDCTNSEDLSFLQNEKSCLLTPKPNRKSKAYLKNTVDIRSCSNRNLNVIEEIHSSKTSPALQTIAVQNKLLISSEKNSGPPVEQNANIHKITPFVSESHGFINRPNCDYRTNRKLLFSASQNTAISKQATPLAETMNCSSSLKLFYPDSYLSTPNTTAALCNIDPNVFRKRDHDSSVLNRFSKFAIHTESMEEDINETHIELVSSPVVNIDKPEFSKPISLGTLDQKSLKPEVKLLPMKWPTDRKKYEEPQNLELKLPDYETLARLPTVADVGLAYLKRANRIKSKSPEAPQLINFMLPATPSIEFLFKNKANENFELISSLKKKGDDPVSYVGAIFPVCPDITKLLRNRYGTYSIDYPRWIYNDLLSFYGSFEFRHRDVHLLKIVFHFLPSFRSTIEKSGAIMFKNIDAHRCPLKKTVCPFDLLIFYEVKKKIPIGLLSFCSSTTHLPAFLKYLEGIFEEALAKITELRSIVKQNGANLYSNDEESCYIKKIHIDVENSAMYELIVRLDEFERANIHHVFINPARSTSEWAFNEDASVGIEFLANFLSNPKKYFD